MIIDSTHKPTYLISIDGDVVPLQGRLIALTLDDNSGFSADELTIDISDHDGAVELPKKGVKLTAEFGFAGQTQNKGDYIVDEVEHHGAPDVVTIRAHSANFRDTLLEQREQSYHDTTLGDILSQIAGRHGLELAIADKYKNIKIEHIDQNNESDANMLTRFAKSYGAVGTIKSNHLLFVERGAGKTASGKALPTVIIKRSDGDSHSYKESDRNERVTAVTAYYHDHANAKRKKIEAEKKKRKRKPKKKKPLTEEEKKKLAEKKKREEHKHGDEKVEVGSSKGGKRSLKRVFATKAEAQKAAEAELKRLQTRAKTLSLNLAFGRADLFAEQPLKVEGFKKPIDETDWFIDKITHSLSDSGYVCSLECEVKI